MTGEVGPSAANEAFAAAVALHQRGRLAEAETIYRSILQRDPRHAGCLHLLGLAHLQRGDPEGALSLVGESVRLDARNAVSRNSLGAVLLQLGRREEALDAFGRAVALKPDYAEALNNAGNALAALGRHAEALERYEQAMRLGFSAATLHYNRGIALHRLGRLEEALASFDEAIAIAPGYAEALANRGEALRLLGRVAEAIESCDRAIALDPLRPQPHINRGTALVFAGRPEEALASYDRAIAADPGSVAAHRNRGDALLRLRRFDDALASLDHALALAPDDPDALLDRITALLELQRHEDAIADCDRALRLQGEKAALHFDRGLALIGLGRFDEALPSVERALALDPAMPYGPGIRMHLRMHLCEWDGFQADCGEIIGATVAGAKAATPLAILALPATARVQLECARTFSRHKYPARPVPVGPGGAFSHDRIRVGYVSSDFRDHPVAHLIAEVLERHDRSRFEITAFSSGPVSRDPWRERIEKGVDRFIEIAAMADDRVADMMRKLEIDVAVDLNGFTLGGRTGLFALRCAPVQVNYLGFPGTMGADYFDYLIADRTVVPEEHEAFYAENIVRLPHCYAPNDSTKRISDRQPGRAELGLPEGGTVFCCFNNAFKITPDAFDVWMRLLLRLPGSVLWLRGAAETARSNLRRNAHERGVSPDRLVFAPVVDLADHFARHRAADLFLDTFHYNAHTTASDALWAGLPVVTLMGETFASRVAASMLRAAEVPELIARTTSEYEALAFELATSPQRLAAVRSRLATRRDTTPLFDTALFVRHLERAFSMMHEQRGRGLPPAPIAVPA